MMLAIYGPNIPCLEALPSMEEPQAVDLADAEKEQGSEAEADVAHEAKETAEAGSHITDTTCPLIHVLNRLEWQVPAPAAKGPARKGPAKGPPKGKGKSSPRLEEGKEAMLNSYRNF